MSFCVVFSIDDALHAQRRLHGWTAAVLRPRKPTRSRPHYSGPPSLSSSATRLSPAPWASAACGQPTCLCTLSCCRCYHADGCYHVRIGQHKVRVLHVTPPRHRSPIMHARTVAQVRTSGMQVQLNVHRCRSHSTTSEARSKNAPTHPPPTINCYGPKRNTKFHWSE